MKGILIGLIFICLSGMSLSANAWVYGENLTIVEVTEWQSDGDVVFKLSSGTTCWIPGTEKKMYSLVLSMFATGIKGHFHCHDAEESIVGVPAHRFHKVVAFR